MDLNPGKPSWTSVCSQTVKRFRAQFQEYFPPLLLANALGYIVYLILQSITGKLSPPHAVSVMDPKPVLPFFVYLTLRISLWSLELWIPWLVFTFALATFTVKLLHARHSPDARMRTVEAFRIACAQRLGSLFGFSFLAGLSMVLCTFLVVPALLRGLPFILMLFRMPRTTYFAAFAVASVFLVLLFVAAVTKAALAVPELLDDPNASLGSAVHNSIKATTGWELYLVSLLLGLGATCSAIYYAGKDAIDHSANLAQWTSQGYEIWLGAFCAVLATFALTLLVITYSVLYLQLRYGADEPSIATAANSV